jgi:thiamine transport system permease protein
MNTLWGILLVHVFYNTTIIIRVVGSAWATLDPRWEETARVLGASRRQTLSKVTLPLLRPSILAATLLVFLFDFTSFGVILLVGGPSFATLEVAIYQQALNLLNLPLAGLLSVLQLICTFAVTWVYSAVNGNRRIPLMPHLSRSDLRRPTSLFEKLQVILVNGALLILLVSPLLAMILRSFLRLGNDQGERGLVQTGFTLRYYQQLFVNSNQSIFYVPPARAVLNSLLFASLTVVFAVLLGSLTAYAMTRNQKMKRWLDIAITLPLGASAVTLGLGFIVTFNRAPFDVMSFPLLIPLAHTLVALPFTIRTIQPALASIPESIQEAAAVLGASRWRVWRKVELPILRREIFVAAVFAFTISLENSAPLHSSPPDLPTLPVAIYRYLSMPGDLNYGQGLAMSTILLVLCAVAIYLLEKFQSGAMREI